MPDKISKTKKPNRIVEPARATISMLTEEKNHFEKLANADNRSLSNFFRINVVENLKRKGKWPAALDKLRQVD